MPQKHSATDVSGTRSAIKNSYTAPQQLKVLLMLEVGSTPKMEFVKNKLKEVWDNQSFVSSQMDGVEF